MSKCSFQDSSIRAVQRSLSFWKQRSFQAAPQVQRGQHHKVRHQRHPPKKSAIQQITDQRLPCQSLGFRLGVQDEWSRLTQSAVRHAPICINLKHGLTARRRALHDLVGGNVRRAVRCRFERHLAVVSKYEVRPICILCYDCFCCLQTFVRGCLETCTRTLRSFQRVTGTSRTRRLLCKLCN